MIEKMNRTPDDAFDLVQMAGVYVDDGAFRTAADRLRQAATILDEVANREAETLTAPINA